jgi:hypothetical protein
VLMARQVAGDVAILVSGSAPIGAEGGQHG